MSKIYDHTNMHFDDVFVICTEDSNGNVSSTDYIYFDETDANEEVESLNTAFSLKHRVCTLTEYSQLLTTEVASMDIN